MNLDDAASLDIAQLAAIADPDPRGFPRMAEEAMSYLTSHSWCRRILRGLLRAGWKGILAVFWVEIEPAHPGVDRSVWVVVGDLPPAYLCNDNRTAWDALNAYVREMSRWVTVVMSGGSFDGIIPVNAPRTTEYAEMLRNRLQFIEEHILSNRSHEGWGVDDGQRVARDTQ